VHPAYLAAVAGEAAARLIELAVSRRNERALRARGAVEHGRGHYPWMVALHASFLASCLLEPALLGRTFAWPLAGPLLAALALAMALRVWAIRALRGRWCTRVLTVPGLPAETGGPYRFLAHPNYVAVQAEILALPLVHGAWLTAAVFGALNLALLRARIRVEEAALRAHSDWEARFRRRP
jgi:methyltransferase